MPDGPGDRVPLGFVALAPLPALAVAALGWWQGVTLNLFEAGTFVSGGMQILDGKAPYTDLFAFYGPLAYIEAGAFGSIGPGLIGIQLGQLVVTCLMAVTTYWLSARISGRPLVSLSVPSLLALGGNLSDRTFLAMVAIVLITQWEVRRSKTAIFLAGALGAMSVLFLQDAGLAFVASVVVIVTIFAVLRRHTAVVSLRAVALGSVGAATVLIPFSIWLVLRGAFVDWLYYCFVYPNVVYTKRSATGYISDLIASWANDRPITLAYHVAFYLAPYLVIFAVALICCLMAWTEALQRTTKVFAPVGVSILGTFSLLQLRTLLASVDEAKLAAAAAPIVVIGLGYAIRGLIWKPVTPRAIAAAGRNISAIVSAACLAWFALWSVQDFAHDLSSRRQLPQVDVATGALTSIRVVNAISPSTSIVDLQSAIAAVDRRTAPDDPIFVAPNSPYLYYLTRRANATPYDYIDPIYTTPEVDQQIADAINSQPPKVIVLTTQLLYTNESPEVYIPRTLRRIRDSYIAVETFGPFTVMVPRH